MFLINTATAKRATENDPIRAATMGMGYMGKALTCKTASDFHGVPMAAACSLAIDKLKLDSVLMRFIIPKDRLIDGLRAV